MLSIRKVYYLRSRNLLLKSFTRGSSQNSSDDGITKEKSDNDTKITSISGEKNVEESVVDRLNRLLASMNTEENFTSLHSLPKPNGRKKKTETATTEKETSDTNKNIIEAAKTVASIYGETNKKQIESELLAKLLNLGNKTHKIQQKDENDLSLSELITGMQIDRKQQPRNQSHSDFVRTSSKGRLLPYHKRNPFIDDGDKDFEKNEQKSYLGSVNLFGCKPLGIFTNPSSLKESPDMLKTWEHLYNRELQIEITHPPRNYFEKMIQWTEQGKLWKFPIDNEQGLDEEAKVDFTEHVFLEQYLEDWCPSRGPIRHYMELVCVGLSKNPYITAKEKKDHIMWYRDYFNEKKEILKDLMDSKKMEIATLSSQQNKISNDDVIKTDL